MMPGSEAKISIRAFMTNSFCFMHPCRLVMQAVTQIAELAACRCWTVTQIDR
ncbi:hypothetical protein BDV97DRAFT_363721 [Delphinella strobiligena]|nr:hypothetical protein BDV97DRAFT_363721 [Delphinella strobiligena]